MRHFSYISNASSIPSRCGTSLTLKIQQISVNIILFYLLKKYIYICIVSVSDLKMRMKNVSTHDYRLNL